MPPKPPLKPFLAPSIHTHYVVTYFDGTQVVDVNALAQIPIRVGPHSAPVTLGSYGKVWRSIGPIAVERNQLERASHIEMQTEGRDIGSAAEELNAKLQANPDTHGIRFDWVGQVALMKNTFS